MVWTKWYWLNGTDKTVEDKISNQIIHPAPTDNTIFHQYRFHFDPSQNRAYVQKSIEQHGADKMVRTKWYG